MGKHDDPAESDGHKPGTPVPTGQPGSEGGGKHGGNGGSGSGGGK